MPPNIDINYLHWRTKGAANSEARRYRGAGSGDQGVTKRVGQMVTPLGTADCKGWEYRGENEHFKFKKVGFSAINKF